MTEDIQEETEETLEEEVQDSENTEDTFEEEDDEDTEDEVEEDDRIAELEKALQLEKNKSKGMYKRLKSEKAKKTLPAKAVSAGVDPFEIAEVTSALQGLDELERDRLIKEARMSNTSLSDAKKSEDYKLWQKGYKGKVVSKTPAPSTKQGTRSRGGSLDEQLSNANPKEQEQILIKAGLVNSRYSSK